jgi:O-antigen/teichoic acid export membrane protein
MALRPMFFAIAIAVAWLIGIPMSVLELVFLTLVAVSLAWGVQYILLRSTLAKLEKPATTPRLVKKWRREAWPLVMVAAFTGLLSELAVLLATPFMQSADVAAFGICLKLAFLVGFAVQAAHQAILPDLGDAAARRERGGMGTKLLAASLFPIVVTGVAVIASVIAGELLLGVFGEEFKAAKTTLVILLIAQLVRALAGPSPHLLTLRGAQTVSAAICAASLGILLIGNALLAPMWGSEGAAISLLVTTIFWLSATAIALHRVGGTRSDLAGLLLRRRALEDTVAAEATK